MQDTWFTVYGAFVPTPPTFKTEAEAINYARANVSNWSEDISVVKSEVIWRSK
jgi:hypothetical protein